MKHKRLKIPIYERNLVLVDAEKLEDVLTKYPMPESVTQDLTDLYGAITINGGIRGKNKNKESVSWNCIYVLFNTKDPNSTTDIGVLAHEAFHVLEYVFMAIDQEHTIQSEPKAYLLGWLVNQMCDFLGVKKEIE